MDRDDLSNCGAEVFAACIREIRRRLPGTSVEVLIPDFKGNPDALRIVVLGESATQGIPSPAFAFVPQLRALLRARYPDKAIEVINTGVVAINSHVVYQIARDAARLSPMRDRLERALLEQVENVHVNGDPDNRLPHMTNLSFAGVESEELMVATCDIAVSSGSACSSASIDLPTSDSGV